MQSRRVTQADVAAMAGVSQATVSLILNDNIPSSVRITEQTKQKVIDAIRITGYSANPAAQRLAERNNQILGVFTYEPTFPSRGRDFYGPFLSGAELAAQKLGVDLLLFTSARMIEGRRRLAHKDWQRLGAADGCLLLGLQEDREELDRLLDTQFPFVFVGKRETASGRLPYVGADYVTATSGEVDRLVALGHRDIGYVGPQAKDPPTRDRIEGYRKAMERHGLPINMIKDLSPRKTAQRIIDQEPSAVLVAPECQPDDLADELEQRGLVIPDDLSMLMLGQPHHPQRRGRQWSGFTIPREELGARALLLLSRLVAERSQSNGSRARVDEADLHQLLECPSVDGHTIAEP